MPESTLLGARVSVTMPGGDRCPPISSRRRGRGEEKANRFPPPTAKRPLGARSAARCGALQSLYLLLALPIVLILFLAVIEFGFVLLVRQTIGAAAQEGVRVASRGGTTADVLAAVNQVLAMHQVLIVPTTADANVVIEASALPPEEITSFPCTPIGPPLSPDIPEHRVTVCVSLSPSVNDSAWQGGTLPDLLVQWGFSLTGQVCTSSALAPTE